jgi:hypothetical protein
MELAPSRASELSLIARSRAPARARIRSARLHHKRRRGRRRAHVAIVAKRSRRPAPAHERSPSKAIVPWIRSALLRSRDCSSPASDSLTVAFMERPAQFARRQLDRLVVRDRVLAGPPCRSEQARRSLTATAPSPGGATVWLVCGSRINRAVAPAAAASTGSSRSVIAAGALCPLRSGTAASVGPIGAIESAANRPKQKRPSPVAAIAAARPTQQRRPRQAPQM